jgi:hypothetical protein
LNKNCACMVDGECRFDFPRQFNQATQQGKDSYPLYRRRDDGWRVKIRGAELDAGGWSHIIQDCLCGITVTSMLKLAQASNL